MPNWWVSEDENSFGNLSTAGRTRLFVHTTTVPQSELRDTFQCI
jgi:hypothetical protein